MTHLSKHRPIQTIKKTIVALLLIPFFAACISDNMDNCPTQLSLQFVHTINKDYTDQFKDKISELDLYIYDQNGNFYEKKHLVRNQMRNQNTVVIDLPVGEYSAVAWAAEPQTDYTIQYNTTLEDMLLKINTTPQGRPTATPQKLFHGRTHLSIRDGVNPTEVIDLTNNINNIHIIIQENRAIPANIALGDYQISLTGCNGSYKYDNSIPTSTMLDYEPQYAIGGATTFLGDFKVYRLLVGDDLRVKIKNSTNQVLFDQSLTQTILQNPSINTNQDLDRLDQYILVFQVQIDMNGAYVMTLISINDWDTTDQNGGIG